jgi:hypothetical protein
MQIVGHLTESGLMNCKCGLCNHDSREDCIKGRCYCCDLEDTFAILSQSEFEPQSRIATSSSIARKTLV